MGEPLKPLLTQDIVTHLTPDAATAWKDPSDDVFLKGNTMELPIELVVDLLTAMSTQACRAHALDPDNKTDTTIHNKTKCVDLLREVAQLAKEQEVPLIAAREAMQKRHFKRSEPPRLIDWDEFIQTYLPKS